MEEIKIYLYVDSENINNYCFVKNKKIFIKINDFNNKKNVIFYGIYAGIPENRLIHYIQVKKLELYEFIFSDYFNECFSNKNITSNKEGIEEYYKLKEYFVACDGEKGDRN